MTSNVCLCSKCVQSCTLQVSAPIHNALLQVVLAIAGGPLPVSSPWLTWAASSMPQAWLIAYHSKMSKLQWNFRPYDPTVYKVKMDSCQGRFEISATRLGQSLLVSIEAAKQSFDGLLCPTSTGFRDESMHSFTGHAKVQAFRFRLWPILRMGWEVIEAQELSNVALEFGGQYRC